MEIVENTLSVPLADVLDRPLFCFLATQADSGPRISPLWFLWEAGSVWCIATRERSYPERIEANPETALAIVDFDVSTGEVLHIGMRGRATVVPHDPERAIRLLEKYHGPEMDDWDQSRFPDPNEWGEEMVFVRFDPETVVARDQSYTPAPAVKE